MKALAAEPENLSPVPETTWEPHVLIYTQMNKTDVFQRRVP